MFGSDALEANWIKDTPESFQYLVYWNCLIFEASINAHIKTIFKNGLFFSVISAGEQGWLPVRAHHCRGSGSHLQTRPRTTEGGHQAVQE